MKKNFKKESIDFVTRYYKPGAFDVRKAWNALGVSIPWYARQSVRRVVWSAAVIAVLLSVGIYYSVSPSQSDNVHLVAYKEIVNVTMPDGSEITLYPGSAIDYKKGSFLAHRDVNLSGKAFFEVTRNEKSAFKVFAGNTEVEVLGTKFLVNQSAQDSVVVTVDSGRVKVTNSEGENCVITAGMSAVTASSSLIVSPVYISIEVSDVSLQYLAEQLNDRYGIQLVNLPKVKDNITLSYNGDVDGLLEIINDMFESDVTVK